MTENRPRVVDLEFVSKGNLFNIYKADGGKFYAATSAPPHFCLEADSEDEAREKGNAAMKSYAEMILDGDAV